MAKIVKDSVIDLLRLDGQPPQEDFVLAECRENPCILHITPSGTPEWIKTGPFGIGIGRPFVHALLEKYHGLIPDEIDMEKGILLAFKVIEEAIEVGTYGLGLPIDIWQITKTGAKNLTRNEMDNLKNRCSELRKLEIELLLKGKDENSASPKNQTSS